MLELSREEARRFLIHYQGLDNRNTFQGKKGILDYLNRVGSIQFDPLNVVGRNPDLVLQSRIGGYSPDYLTDLLYTDRKLVDGWDKMLSIYNVEDWFSFHRIRKSKKDEIKRTLAYRNSMEALELTGDIRKLLMEKGPLQSSQIDLGKTVKGRWGHKKMSGAALDYMFNIGELCIYGKKNTRKIYDLTENILSGEIPYSMEPFKTDRDFYKWYFKRRIGSIGLLWSRSGGGWLGHFLSDRKLRLSVLSELMEEGEIESLSIADIDETFYIRREDLSLMDSCPKEEGKSIRFLAPLDNLLWDRDMAEKIFGFKYRWEVYTPVVKRQYGYYVLPVLWGDKLIGRFEPYKEKNTLKIRNWWWEEGFCLTDGLGIAIKKSLKHFSEYLGVELGSVNYKLL